MTNEIGVGLIGYGLAGRAFHAPYINVTPGLGLRAIVSHDPAKVHADLPDTAVLPDVTALLAKPGIDLVVVASPDHLHAEHAIAALTAGKHVIVDKPFATSLADAQAMADAAKASGKMLTIFHNRRWDADFLTLRRLIADDILGEIVHFESHFDRWRPIPADLWKERRAGGIWQDLGPHLIDQAFVLFGLPRSIHLDLATLRKEAVAPDYCHAILRYPGRRVILHASKIVAENAARFIVHGRRGSWTKSGADMQEAKAVAGLRPDGPSWGDDPCEGQLTLPGQVPQRRPLANQAGDYRAFWSAVVEAVLGNGLNPVPAADGLAVMRVLEAGFESEATAQEISLD